MVAIPTRVKTMLTGRVRSRPGLFGRQVLQVEHRHQRHSLCPPPPGRKDDAEWQEFVKRGDPWFTWTDATWEDAQFLGELTSAFRTAAYGTNPTRAAGVNAPDGGKSNG